MEELKLPELKKFNDPNKKPFVVVMAPFATRSGYGDHSRDIIRSLIRSNQYDIGLVSINWGATPLNALDEQNDMDIISKMIMNPQMLREQRPDIFIHITIPNEFAQLGKYNIGITAGIETTVCKPEWIEGINRMDKVIVPSEFAKTVFLNTNYEYQDNQTGQIGVLKVNKPIDVVFEGSDTNKYYKIKKEEYEKIKNSSIKKQLDSIKENFAFLVVGHWLQGEYGHDRKDIATSIQLFLEVFKSKIYKEKPALVIKTSGATFSQRDYHHIESKIKDIQKLIVLDKGDKLPNVYLLHGELTDTEMNELYNHPKIKSLYSLTKGEGYGRPLQEFALTGKPVLVSNWSGQVDFIKTEFHTLLKGEVKQVHPSASDSFIIPESGWFYINYQQAGEELINVFKSYSFYRDRSENGLNFLIENKTLDNMQEVLINSIENKNSGVKPLSNVKKLSKIKIPNLNNGNQENSEDN